MYTNETGAQKILLVRCSSMGDILLTLPAVQLLRNRRPELTIHYCCYSRWRGILQCATAVDNVIPFPVRFLHRQIKQLRLCHIYILLKKIRSRLRRTGYSKSIDLHNTTDSALSVMWSNSSQSYGQRRQLLAWFFSHRFSFPESNIKADRHATQLTAQAFFEAGLLTSIPDQLPAPEWDFPKYCNSSPVILSAQKKPPILLFPFASHPEKSWPPENFSELLHLLKDQTKDVLICVSRKQQKLLNKLNVYGAAAAVGLPLPVLLKLISISRLVIGNDSGPLHAAAMMGIPGVAIFTTANMKKFTPYSHCVTALFQDVDCRPCTPRRARKCNNKRCMEIPPADVAHTVLTKLQSERSG